MDKLTIDPTTGFPALPERYYWEITEYSLQIRKDVHEDTDTFEYKYPHSRAFSGGFMGSYKWRCEDAEIEDQEEKVVKETTIIPKQGFWAKLFALTEESVEQTTRVVSGTITVAQARIQSGNMHEPVAKALHKFAEHEEQLRVSAMIGKYPPNKLSAVIDLTEVAKAIIELNKEKAD